MAGQESSSENATPLYAEGGPELDFGAMRDHSLERLRHLYQFAELEFGAYEYFQRIAGVVSGIEPPSIVFKEGSIDSQTVKHIAYPLINYDPEPGNSDVRRQIMLYDEHTLEAGQVVAVRPSLYVFTLDAIQEHGANVECCELEFGRDELEVLCGLKGLGELQDMAEEAVSHTPDASMGRMMRRRQQAEYIGWLDKAAWALDLPRQFSAASLSVTGTQPN